MKAEELAEKAAAAINGFPGQHSPYDIILDAIRAAEEEERKRCAEIARAIDSGRGNESIIAESIENAE